MQNAHVAGVMTSYNAINGTPSPADTYTANELLQRTYGFNGYTTSDCGAIGNIYLPTPGNHEWAPPGWTTTAAAPLGRTPPPGSTLPAAAGGQAYALRAGTDLNCTGPEATLANIQAAIDGGVLSEGVIDNALVHLFTHADGDRRVRPARPGGLHRRSPRCDPEPAHQALAEKVAAERHRAAEERQRDRDTSRRCCRPTRPS